ncbi:Protein CCC1 [Lachnellula cervina]|uniref:Protein CCC1 n=1 Tax=Lachnellula cervina TaxID=1316786 RepID=A0A7D8UX18_9HELO|nr:Protein CCC1 [Lachnellula cervina]
MPTNFMTHLENDSTPASHSRPIIRRRRPPSQPPHSPIKAMSLVGLKNLFFSQTRTPIPRHQSKPKTRGYPDTSDWSNVSSEPLLPSNNADPGELESQSRSKTEKAQAKKGFRIDARVISDATIGLSDGLTVPFALTAGLSALGNTKVVIYGGFAELIAGAISMGLGGYLGAKSEAASYAAQKAETESLIHTQPQTILSDLTTVFEPYDLPRETLTNLTSHLAASPKLVDFVMQFQHCESEPASSRALTSALTIALAYFFGGLLPLTPYFFVGPEQVFEGLYISIGVMVLALFAFGYVKTCVVVGWEGGRAIRQGCFGGVQMVVVGSAAAGAAMGLVRLFNDGGV